MLNSLLNHFLFGSLKNENNDDDNRIDEEDKCLRSAINHTNEIGKYVDIRNDVDWVIVDPSDNDEVKKHLKRKLNSMEKMQMSEFGLNRLFDSQQQEDCNSSSSGKNVIINDEPMQQEEPQQKTIEQDSWLITPLPSLVSLQTSQKSLIENAPLENLLIEHPSMSVFITQEEINDAEEATDENSSFSLIENSKDDEMKSQEANKQEKKTKNKKKKKKTSIAVVKQQETTKVDVQQNTADIQNGSKTRNHHICQPTNKIASTNKLVNSKQFYKEHFNSIKLLEKCKYYVQNVNTKQRKYHNLQQPQYLNAKLVNIRH